MSYLSRLRCLVAAHALLLAAALSVILMLLVEVFAGDSEPVAPTLASVDIDGNLETFEDLL